MARIAKEVANLRCPLCDWKGKAVQGVGLACCVLLSLLTQIASREEISKQIWDCSGQAQWSDQGGRGHAQWANQDARIGLSEQVTLIT